MATEESVSCMAGFFVLKFQVGTNKIPKSRRVQKFFGAPATREHGLVNDPSKARALDKSRARTAENAAGV